MTRRRSLNDHGLLPLMSVVVHPEEPLGRCRNALCVLQHTSIVGYRSHASKYKYRGCCLL